MRIESTDFHEVQQALGDLRRRSARVDGIRIAAVERQMLANSRRKAIPPRLWVLALLLDSLPL